MAILTTDIVPVYRGGTWYKVTVQDFLSKTSLLTDLTIGQNNTGPLSQISLDDVRRVSSTGLERFSVLRGGAMYRETIGNYLEVYNYFRDNGSYWLSKPTAADWDLDYTGYSDTTSVSFNDGTTSTCPWSFTDTTNPNDSWSYFSGGRDWSYYTNAPVLNGSNLVVNTNTPAATRFQDDSLTITIWLKKTNGGTFAIKTKSGTKGTFDWNVGVRWASKNTIQFGINSVWFAPTFLTTSTLYDNDLNGANGRWMRFIFTAKSDFNSALEMELFISSTSGSSTGALLARYRVESYSLPTIIGANNTFVIGQLAGSPNWTGSMLDLTIGVGAVAAPSQVRFNYPLVRKHGVTYSPWVGSPASKSTIRSYNAQPPAAERVVYASPLVQGS